MSPLLPTVIFSFSLLWLKLLGEDFVRFIDNFLLVLAPLPRPPLLQEAGSLVLEVLILEGVEKVFFLRKGRCWGTSLVLNGSSISSKEVTDPIDIELALDSRYWNETIRIKPAKSIHYLTFCLLPWVFMVSKRAWYNWAATETASSVDLQMNPWHSNSFSLPVVLVMQANMGGCCGSSVDLLVYFSSDFAKGQNNLRF